MYHDLYTNISKSVGLLTVFLDDEQISQGSCFCTDASGAILTAAHVVTGRTPINQEDLKDPGLKYLVKFPNIPLLEYTVKLCAMTIEVEAFSKPIQIDIALLFPKQNYQIKYPVIPTSVIPPRHGEEVFLAGYSDELEIPFSVERIIDKKGQGAPEFLEAMSKGYMADMTGPMIKRAVIGNHRVINASNSNLNINLSCDIFYLDNAMHSGASGGPMINKSGDAVGIITQRAVTSASQRDVPSLSVPSGSTVAISLQSLVALNAFYLK